ncbi:stomatin-like [Corticium candelabrum]|uniref:stomatin-like n=1 Tax=Corticium candelabrum TaxID=121492 RepID=UPI002E271828|nr:stomatin-like [Corticium candelabrum]
MELDLLKRPILRADLTHRPLSDTNLHALDASRPVKQQEEANLGCGFYVCMLFSLLIVLLTFPFSLFFCIKIVTEYERAVIFRLGRIISGRGKGPGLIFILPCLDNIRKVDLRTVSFDIPPQQILTRDSVSAVVDAVVYYRIQNPTMSVAEVENVSLSTFLLAQTTLRNMLGTKTLAEILAEREAISHEMQKQLGEATDKWGVKVEIVEMKDVRLPQELQRAMAVEAAAAREARAKVIAAEGEQNAARALREASSVLDQSPAAVQLRYLQTLTTISAQQNHTYLFPLPLTLLREIFGRGKSHKT